MVWCVLDGHVLRSILLAFLDRRGGVDFGYKDAEGVLINDVMHGRKNGPSH